jgi:hypothetical protein
MEHLEAAKKRAQGMQDIDEKVPLIKKIDQMLTEARVILPGAQALLGFQLTVVLTDAFERLAPDLQIVHGLALACIAAATMLLMAPAAYHRIVYGGEVSEDVYRLGGKLIMAGTFMLAIGLAADTHVIVTKTTGNSMAGMTTAGVSFLLLAGLWHISPWVTAHHGRVSVPQTREARADS